MKIDFVIPWVDGNDDNWRAKKDSYKGVSGDGGAKRYRDWGTLKYWFRGVAKFAPWVNHVYLISDGQKPDWINEECDKLTIVDHKDYIPEKYLPTFSANPIELNLHNIEGLSEHFVYFNDDFFLVKDVAPELFFKNGVPCDDAILSPIIMEDALAPGQFCANNMGIINKYFDKKEVMKDKKKWFAPCYGKQMLRTMCLMPWHHLPGFFNDHLPQPYLKATFREVWEKEPELLSETCTHRFRDYRNDVNQWVFRYWQICSGNFTPISPKRGKCYNDVCDAAINEIKNQTRPIIVINDNSDDLYDEYHDRLIGAFESILGEKSVFEK